MTDVERAAEVRGKTIRFIWTDAVSYLASSGYTLTVILHFGDQRLVGFASSAKDWHPLRGTFEVVK